MDKIYVQTLRDDGLRRGFDALDVEHTGEIPVEKFKERIRKVLRIFNEAHTIFLLFATQCLICENIVFLMSTFSKILNLVLTTVCDDTKNLTETESETFF